MVLMLRGIVYWSGRFCSSEQHWLMIFCARASWLKVGGGCFLNIFFFHPYVVCLLVVPKGQLFCFSTFLCFGALTIVGVELTLWSSDYEYFKESMRTSKIGYNDHECSGWSNHHSNHECSGWSKWRLSSLFLGSWSMVHLYAKIILHIVKVTTFDWGLFIASSLVALCLVLPFFGFPP